MATIYLPKTQIFKTMNRWVGLSKEYSVKTCTRKEEEEQRVFNILANVSFGTVLINVNHVGRLVVLLPPSKGHYERNYAGTPICLAFLVCCSGFVPYRISVGGQGSKVDMLLSQDDHAAQQSVQYAYGTASHE
jgi:hypothetical protein